ncbi:hypothetical protein TNCV_4696071 [Trichonephila clavipes]|nr:hypothetical protein TNCV_4696071 [Trichonephila clavipes]
MKILLFLNYNPASSRNIGPTDKITPTEAGCTEIHGVEKTEPSWIFAQMVGMAACSLPEIIKSNKCTTHAENSNHLSLQPDATEKVIENGQEELCICINYTTRSRDVRINGQKREYNFAIDARRMGLVLICFAQNWHEHANEVRRFGTWNSSSNNFCL